MLNYKNIDVDISHIEQKLFDETLHFSKSELVLYSLLHTEYITTNQCLALAFSSPHSINIALNKLEKKNLIKSVTYIEGMKNKAYYLTRKGFNKIQLEIPNHILIEKNIAFKEILSLASQIAHKTSANDMYFCMLTAPKTEKFEWLNEKQSTIIGLNEKVVFRNDARFRVSNSEYWIEQDMGTETSTQLKTKANQLAKYINTLKEKPNLLFSIDLTYTINNYKRGHFYSSLKKEKTYLKNLQEIYKNYRNNGHSSLTHYKVNLKAKIHNSLIPERQIKGLTNHLNILEQLPQVFIIDDLKNLITKSSSALEDKKEKILSQKYDSRYTNRIEIIKNALANQDINDYVSLYNLMLKGLDVYIERNENLIDLFHNNLLNNPSLVIQTLKKFASLTDLNYEQVKNTKVRQDTDKKFFFNSTEFYIKNFYTLSNEDAELNLDIGIEDMTSNLGAEVRIKKVLDTVNASFPIYLICIVNNFEEALALSNEYQLERYIKLETSDLSVYFADKESLKSELPIYAIKNGLKE